MGAGPGAGCSFDLWRQHETSKKTRAASHSSVITPHHRGCLMSSFLSSSSTCHPEPQMFKNTHFVSRLQGRRRRQRHSSKIKSHAAADSRRPAIASLPRRAKNKRKDNTCTHLSFLFFFFFFSNWIRGKVKEATGLWR